MLSDAVAIDVRLGQPVLAQVMKPIGPILQRLLKKWPKLVVQLVYLQLVHIKELASKQPTRHPEEETIIWELKFKDSKGPCKDCVYNYGRCCCNTCVFPKCLSWNLATARKTWQKVQQ